MGGGKFDANKSCSNAMILTFLHRAAGEPVSTAQAPVELKVTQPLPVWDRKGRTDLS